MNEKTSSEKRKGRPRDERARRSVLDAVRCQLRGQGLCGMTMEGIARQAGVGKQTLYRWWPSLADVALEALAEEAGEACPVPCTEDLEADLRTFLRGTFRAVRLHTGPLLRCLMVEAQKREAFRETFRTAFVLKRQEVLAGLLRRGGPDTDLAVDLVYGTLWYRLQVGHAPLDDELADALARTALSLVVRP